MLRIVDYIRCDLSIEGVLTCSFEDWNMDYTGTTWTEKMDTMLINGLDENEVEEKRQELLTVFENWCEDYSIEGIEI